MNTCVYPALLLLLCASAGCGDASNAAGWRFRFAEPGLGARAEVVETEIRRGGCDGESVFITRVSPTSAGESAPDLDAGRYGFRGRARNAECEWYAEGCAEAELPQRGSIEIVLDRSMFPTVDPSCVPGEQTGDPVTGDDAGAGNGSAGDDGGLDNVPAIDGGTVTGDAAMPPAFDAKAPKCTKLDTSVVACLDFENVLTDASSAGNDAVATNAPSFEAALSGNGLRVDGQRVALEDDATLNVTAFSVEIWLRPDALVNLDGQVNDISLLIDKDQQYNVGFTAQGALRMQVYRGIEDTETTTAENAVVRVDQFSYLAFTYDGTRSTIYLNGQHMESENVGFALFGGNGGALHIGSGSPSTTRPFNGLIDALRISNVARSDAQICAAAGKARTAAGCQ